MSDSKPFTITDYLPYVIFLLMFGLGIWVVLTVGFRLYPTQPYSLSTQPGSSSASTMPGPHASPNESAFGRGYLTRILHDNFRDSLGVLLLQLVVIIVAVRSIGGLFRRIRQPVVLGEIVAGIVLGPSLLGWLYPGATTFIFPAASMEMLKLLSQIGVALFMFVVGMELDAGRLRQKAHVAIMVSHASIIVPFFLGTALALLIYPTLAAPNTSFAAFALFIGIAMSITAFPVLARILEDRQMSQTYLGSIALTCAAVDDVTAWCALALVIAFAQSGKVATSFLTITLTLGFIVVMLFIIKPQLGRLAAGRMPAKGNSNEERRAPIAAAVAFVLACALFTETIGIHSLFGAFLAGVVMPSTGSLRVRLKQNIEPLTGAALLPLFFALTGLRMEITLLSDWYSWAMCAAIILVAITGKLGASMLMARWTGMNWRNSFSLGVLMNTRGLVELIVLNLGYDLGILSGRLFAMLVLMALVTTFMTGPLLAVVSQHDAAPAPA